MTLRPVVLACALAVASLVSLPAAAPHMPLDEIRAGMVGTGRTVFTGNHIEEFNVSILGVLHNVIAPSRSLILAKLEGGPLAHTGVIAGMSGSPVYIDGRLIGAVAYSLGAFSKEPIAGITPIGEMIEAAALDTRRPATKSARLAVPITREAMAQALRQAFTWARPFAEQPQDVQVLAALNGQPIDAQVGMMLRPISTPLVMGGFQPEVMELFGGAFRPYGFVPMAAGGSAADTPKVDGPLRPGDPVGVELIGGDLSVAATGTVTHVDGTRVYAFGHPFYNLGPTQFPMTRAYVHALLPSLFTSMKLSTTGEIIGTIQQDRATTVAGLLGKGPQTIPMTITLDTERGLKKTFRFRVVNDQLFTPLLTYVSILNTLGAYERQFGAASFSVKGKAVVKKHGVVGFEDLFTGNNPSIGAAAYIAGPLTFLLGNDFEPVEIEALDLAITSTEEPKTATLERVWVDARRPRAGMTVPLRMLMRTYRGEEVIRTLPIDIPANATGTLSILVADGSRLSQFEQRELRQAVQPYGVPQMIRAFNKARKNNRLYVRLLASEAGAVVNGEYLSSLPPSVLAVLEADRHSGNFVPLRSATVGEWELPVEHAVIGSRMLTIDVDPY